MKEIPIAKESFTNYRSAEVEGSWRSQSDATENEQKNFVTYLNLFQSDLYCINDLNCYYDSPHVFKPNFTRQFSINITRKGYFTFQTFRRLEEEFASRIMLEKPGCEFKFVQQEPGPGSCTVFSFSDDAYDMIKDRYPLQMISFFSDENAFSTVVSSDAQADFIHHQILTHLNKEEVSRLQIDCLVMELIDAVLRLLFGHKPIKILPVNTRRYHLQTIERAKEYLLEHFAEDVTLNDLARYCYVSHFHFTRLFKQFCGFSPFHYLHHIRLKHAETLIRNSNLPVTDICFRSGFRRVDYFSTAFARVYGASPTKYRIIATERYCNTKISIAV